MDKKLEDIQQYLYEMEKIHGLTMYLTRNVIALSIVLLLASCGGTSSSSENKINIDPPSILLPENKAQDFSLNTETAKVYLDVAYGGS